MNTPKFDEKQQNQVWKNKLAKQLNQVLGHARSCRDSAATIEGLVARIADFEEIETFESLNRKQG
jgi:hypothetical protein